jgi:hypothetical protein
MHAMRVRYERAVAVLALPGMVWALGCDDAGGGYRPPPPPSDSGPRDAVALDTSVPDAFDDAADGAIGAGACTFDPADLRTLATALVQVEDAPALAVRNGGALMGYVGFIGGDPRLQVRWFPADLALPAALHLTEAESRQRDPVMVATMDGYLAVWRDDVGGTFGLRARAVNATGQALGDDDVELTAGGGAGAPALGWGHGQALVAWVEGDGGFTLRVDGEGAPLAAPVPVAGLADAARRPAVAALSEGYLLAWVDGEGRVWLQALDAAGAPDGAAQRADAEGIATGNVDLASSGGAGAALFDVRVNGVRAEVRFRAFSSSGAPTGSERVLTPAPERGVASSLAPLLGGYVAAHRGETDGAAGEALRVRFVDGSGASLGSFIEVADTTPPATHTVVRAAPNGNLAFVAWTDGTAAKLARLVCQ